MGFKAGILLLMPVFILLVGITLTVGASAPTLQGNQSVVFCNPNNTNPANCVPPGSLGTAYFCQAGALNNLLGIGACQILPNCNITPPAPAYCVPAGLSQVYYASALGSLSCLLNNLACGVWLPTGANVFITTSVIAGNLASTGGLFGFNIAGSQAFISMIGIAVGLISLAGFTVFGSGVQSESVHVLFMGGMLLGFWLILAGLEGFITGNPASMFSQLNSGLPGAGTLVYGGLTLSYTLGFVGSVSSGT